MQGMDPGERQDAMGDRQDGAGMVTGTQLGQQEVMETGMLLPKSTRDAGDRPHQASRASDEMVKDTCLCPARRVSRLCFPEEFQGPNSSLPSPGRASTVSSVPDSQLPWEQRQELPLTTSCCMSRATEKPGSCLHPLYFFLP